MKYTTKWSRKDIRTLKSVMEHGISEGKNVSEIARDYVYVLMRSEDAIRKKWDDLQKEDEGKSIKRLPRVGWSTRFYAPTLALLRSLGEGLGMQQNDVVKEALEYYYSILEDKKREKVDKLMKENLKIIVEKELL